MPTTTTRKNLILNTVSVSLGCGSTCKKTKLSFFFHPKPKTKESHYQKGQKNSSSSHYNVISSSSSSSLKTNYTDYYDTASAATFSPNVETRMSEYWDSDVEYSRTVRGFGRVGADSVAIEKDSDDPYLDFRYSMLQMMLEKEIYSKDDLKELLHCFLQLNSPYHHEIIVRAFTEIWNGLFSVKSGSSSSSKLRYSGYRCK